jgi:hypothetical protein
LNDLHRVYSLFSAANHFFPGRKIFERKPTFIMSRLASIAAALALFSTSNAHMILKTPAPFGSPDNSPLSSDGSNYPCKLTGDAATFYTGTSTSMAVGENQTLSFTGSAVHGGGSCQLAITTDKAPSATTAWSVILSIEGGCPSTDGNGPSEYSYSIPDSVPSGDYVFAWTWISKMSGAPEYYMNCAPITVTGSSSKRSIYERDDMPNLFVANLADINDCKSRSDGSSIDVLYPNPGSNVIQPGTSNAFKDPVGTNCFPKGGSEAGVLSGGSSSGGSSGSSGSSAAASATTAATTVKASTAAAATSVASGGGVFITVPSSAAATTLATTTQAQTSASSAAQATTTQAQTTASPAASASAGSGSSSGSGGSELSGSCTTEGEFSK